MSNTNDGDDILHGARAIGAHLSMSARSIYHLIATGRGFPYFTMGTARLCARRSDLDRWIGDQVQNNLNSGRTPQTAVNNPSDHD